MKFLGNEFVKVPDSTFLVEQYQSSEWLVSFTNVVTSPMWSRAALLVEMLDRGFEFVTESEGKVWFFKKKRTDLQR